ncbi:hypothetical protein pb186bvf_017478 [Paramecium bursaria]
MENKLLRMIMPLIPKKYYNKKIQMSINNIPKNKLSKLQISSNKIIQKQLIKQGISKLWYYKYRKYLLQKQTVIKGIKQLRFVFLIKSTRQRAAIIERYNVNMLLCFYKLKQYEHNIVQIWYHSANIQMAKKIHMLNLISLFDRILEIEPQYTKSYIKKGKIQNYITFFILSKIYEITKNKQENTMQNKILEYDPENISILKRQGIVKQLSSNLAPQKSIIQRWNIYSQQVNRIEQKRLLIIFQQRLQQHYIQHHYYNIQDRQKKRQNFMTNLYYQIQEIVRHIKTKVIILQFQDYFQKKWAKQMKPYKIMTKQSRQILKMKTFILKKVIIKQLQDLYQKNQGYSIIPYNFMIKQYNIIKKTMVIIIILQELLQRSWEQIKMQSNVIRMNPNDSDYHNNKGQNYVNVGLHLEKLGRKDEALQFYDIAIYLNPENDNALTNRGYNFLILGIRLYQLGMFDEAIFLINRAIQLNPQNDLCIQYQRKQNYNCRFNCRLDEALSHFDKAIQINSKNDTAFNNKGDNQIILGLCFQQLDRQDEAMQLYNIAIQLNPSNGNAFNNIGCNKKIKFFRIYFRIIRLNNIILASLLEQLGQIDEALKFYDKAIQLNQDSTANYKKGYNFVIIELLLENLRRFYQSIQQEETQQAEIITNINGIDYQDKVQQFNPRSSVFKKKEKIIEQLIQKDESQQLDEKFKQEVVRIKIILLNQKLNELIKYIIITQKNKNR